MFGDETAAFRDRVKQMLLGTQQIVVNLSGIEYIDSGGIGTLVGMLASTRKRNPHGEIKLVRPNQRVADLLQRTRLNTVFKSYESNGRRLRPSARIASPYAVARHLKSTEDLLDNQASPRTGANGRRCGSVGPSVGDQFSVGETEGRRLAATAPIAAT